MTGVTQKICYRMRKEIAAKIAVVPMSYFNGHSKGDVLSRITNDVDTLGQSLNQSVTQLITSVTQIIGVLVMMLSISLPLTGVTVLTLPAAAIILTVMIHFSQPYFPRATAGPRHRQRHYRGGLCRSERHPGVRPRRGLDRGVRPSKRPPL